jgi:hypothetical protein
MRGIGCRALAAVHVTCQDAIWHFDGRGGARRGIRCMQRVSPRVR